CRGYAFFFQAEDGIRDYKVTGVQTCALPISCACTGATPTTSRQPRPQTTFARVLGPIHMTIPRCFQSKNAGRYSILRAKNISRRSEERRVGKEWRSRWVA